jgi:hypothetical protein
MIDRDRQENFRDGRAVVRQSGVAALCHFIPAVVCAFVSEHVESPAGPEKPSHPYLISPPKKSKNNNMATIFF